MELVSQPSMRVVFETCMECVFRDAQGCAWDCFEALHGVRFQDLHKVVFEIPKIRDVQQSRVLQYVQMSDLLWSGIWSVSPSLLSPAFSITSRDTAWRSSSLFLLRPVKQCLWVRVAAVGVAAGDIRRQHRIFSGGVLALFIGYGEPWRH